MMASNLILSIRGENGYPSWELGVLGSRRKLELAHFCLPPIDSIVLLQKLQAEQACREAS